MLLYEVVYDSNDTTNILPKNAIFVSFIKTFFKNYTET
jgi:hypothetical protein